MRGEVTDKFEVVGDVSIVSRWVAAGLSLDMVEAV